MPTVQEEKVAQRFKLDRGTTPQQATAAVVKLVEEALGGTFERTSDTGFAGTGLVVPNRTNALDRKIGAEPAHKIKVTGQIKDHGNGEFSTLITLNHDGANGVGKFVAIGGTVGIVVWPIIGAVLSWFIFRGSLMAGVVGGGVGLLIGLAIARAQGKMPKKSVRMAREAVESKLAAIEFADTSV
jgi:hypothetical protein